MISNPLFNQFQHALKSWKHKSFRFYLWTMDDLGLAYVATPKVASNVIRGLIRQRQAKILFAQDEEIKLNKGFNKEFKTKLDKKIKRSLRPAQVEALKGDLYLFSFVRNPLARLYSCYRDKVVNAANRRTVCTFSPYGINFGMTFAEFVGRIAEIPDTKANDHFRSLHTFLTYQGVSFVDYIGKIEQFNHDWEPLRQRFGLPTPPRDLNSRRVSGPKIPFIELPYTREIVDVAVKRYARDIELYGYGNEIDFLVENLKKR